MGTGLLAALAQMCLQHLLRFTCNICASLCKFVSMICPGNQDPICTDVFATFLQAWATLLSTSVQASKTQSARMCLQHLCNLGQLCCQRLSMQARPSLHGCVCNICATLGNFVVNVCPGKQDPVCTDVWHHLLSCAGIVCRRLACHVRLHASPLHLRCAQLVCWLSQQLQIEHALRDKSACPQSGEVGKKGASCLF